MTVVYGFYGHAELSDEGLTDVPSVIDTGTVCWLTLHNNQESYTLPLTEFLIKQILYWLYPHRDPFIVTLFVESTAETEALSLVSDPEVVFASLQADVEANKPVLEYVSSATPQILTQAEFLQRLTDAAQVYYQKRRQLEEVPGWPTLHIQTQGNLPLEEVMILAIATVPERTALVIYRDLITAFRQKESHASFELVIEKKDDGMYVFEARDSQKRLSSAAFSPVQVYKLILKLAQYIDEFFPIYLV